MFLVNLPKIKKKAVLFATAVLLLHVFSCKNKDKNSQETPPSVGESLLHGASFSDPYFYKTLEGTIAGKPVLMHFLKYNNQISANYYYIDKGETIFLLKNWDQTNTDSIYLIEDTNDGSGISPQLSLSIGADGIEGTWKSPDAKNVYPIVLKEATSGESLHFTAVSYADSADYLKFKTDTPRLKSSVTMVMASNNNADAEWLNKRFKNILDNGDNRYAGLALPEVVKEIVENEKMTYKGDVDSSTVGISSKELEDTHYFLNREYNTTANIIYNNHQYVVLSVFNYAYTGGAHGNYGTSMHCFDVTNQKKLVLQDIVNTDSLTIQNLLEKNYRRKYNLSQNTPLENSLFVEHLAPNNNFYFTSTGLGFIYLPYEIASYANGEINVWIPFSDLKNYLNPDFAKRMAL